MPFKQGNIPWNKGISGYHSKKNIEGNLNPNWKGGSRANAEGYVQVRWNRKPKLEHRLIAEKVLGRPLKTNEVVHHINGKKQDNRNCNLLICTMSYHRWLENKMADLYKKEHFSHI